MCGGKLLWRAAVVTLAGLACVTLEQRHLGRALHFQEQAGWRTLAGTASRLLTKAHKNNDDPGLYEIIGALSGAPGLVKAEVVGRDTRWNEAVGEVSFSLADGKDRWGKLVLTPSGHLKKKLFIRHLLLTLPLFGLWGAALVLSMGDALHTQRRLEKRAQDLSNLLADETLRRNQAESHAAGIAQRHGAGLRIALSAVERPLILLDGSQRVAAVSPSALARLGGMSLESTIGKSWLELPPLSAAGHLITKSLATPGQEISSDVVPGPPRWSARAYPLAGGGAWVGITVE